MYNFIQSDGGRSIDKVRRKHNNDCMVRAVATATHIPYGEVYDDLCAEGVFTPGQEGFMNKFVHQLAWEDKTCHGFQLVCQSFATKKGHPRMNPEEFADKFLHGIYILRMRHDYCTMIDGNLYDDVVHTDMRCVYGAWGVRRADETRIAA